MPEQASADLREEVRARYGAAARAVLEPEQGRRASCCGTSHSGSCRGTGAAALDTADVFGGPLYRAGETDGLPEEAVLASLGCGNPIAVADLHEGERVLDLGSGGGIDVLLSARRVGPAGYAYGVDMTDDMITLARANAAKAGAANVEFLKGDIEAIPLPDASVDVVISNCVINLIPDKAQVFREAFRALKPGGRLAVSDVINVVPLSAELAAKPELLCGCIAGAAPAARIEEWLAAAGFVDIRITPRPESSELIATWVPGSGIENHVVSAIIEARKPRP